MLIIYKLALSCKKRLYKTALFVCNKYEKEALLDGARRVAKSYIAEQFGKNEYKSYLMIDVGARFRDYEGSFMWLADAIIVNNCYNATEPTVGLAMSKEHTTRKCYMGDTGLLITHWKI